MSGESENPVRLSTFKVQFYGPAATATKKIYANGKMQVRVQVLLSAVNGNGRPAFMSAKIFNNVRLINYKTGELLSDGWGADERPNKYAQALYGVSAEGEGEHPDPYTRIRTFWVSSAVATDIQIGAAVVFNDKLIRSNNTTVGNKFDSSVSVEAEVPVIYEISKFRLDSVVNHPVPDCTLTHFYLSLNVDGRQVRLVDWSEKVFAEQGLASATTNVFDAHGYYLNSPYWWRSVCFIAGVNDKEIPVVLTPEQDSSQYRIHYVSVNDRKGALSIIQGVSLEFTDNTYNKRNTFYFAVFDVYGTGHDLCLRFDNSVLPGAFFLEKA